MRNQLIINHAKLYRSLERPFEKLGFVCLHDDWLPHDDCLQQTAACLVSFYDMMKYPFRFWRLKRRLNRHQIPLIAWNRDAPHYMNKKTWRLDLFDKLRWLDIYLTHTLVDEKRDFAKQKIYFPNAANTDFYHISHTDKSLEQLRNPDMYRWDVSFFGGMDGSRYKEDYQREVFFRALAERLEQLNISYRFQESAGMSVAEQLQFIQQSRINLNFGARCEYGTDIASGLPERCYGIPATGGFLLCDRRTHARDDFSPGENWAEFDSLDDCVDKIVYWLEHFDKARELAEKCHRHVLAQHTYEHRAHFIMSLLTEWHQGD